jgi:hypothetical protein
MFIHVHYFCLIDISHHISNYLILLYGVLCDLLWLIPMIIPIINHGKGHYLNGHNLTYFILCVKIWRSNILLYHVMLI